MWGTLFHVTSPVLFGRMSIYRYVEHSGLMNLFSLAYLLEGKFVTKQQKKEQNMYRILCTCLHSQGHQNWLGLSAVLGGSCFGHILIPRTSAGLRSSSQQSPPALALSTVVGPLPDACTPVYVDCERGGSEVSVAHTKHLKV
jgi:hypothetical protein